MNDLREISLDTETTGLNPNDGHRIVEIGCVELINKVPTGNVYHVYVNPLRDMPEEAFRVHGISSEFLQDKPLFRKICKEFLDFIGTSTLVIHNAAFDIKFLNAELGRCGMTEIPMNRTVDTLLMARKKFPKSPANLDALCKRYNISLKDRTKHGALLDAKLLAMVYIELVGKQSAFKLNSEKKHGNMNGIKSFIEPREFKPTADELTNHSAFMEKINKK